MKIDELNSLTETTVRLAENMAKGDMADEKEGEMEDSILDLLIMAYMYGTDDADFILGTAKPPDTDAMRKALYRKIDGKDWTVRVKESLHKPTVIPVITPEGETYGTAEVIPERKTGDLKRIIETECHRVYNEAVLDRGNESGETVYKTWSTMLDGRVREDHSYLEGQTIPLGEKFYTYDGKSALYPGGFGSPEEDCNCRCYIKLTRQGSL